MSLAFYGLLSLARHQVDQNCAKSQPLYLELSVWEKERVCL